MVGNYQTSSDARRTKETRHRRPAAASPGGIPPHGLLWGRPPGMFVAAPLTIDIVPAARTNPRAPDDTRRTFVFYQTAARDVKQRVTESGSNRHVPMPILVGNEHKRSAPFGQRRLC